MHVYCYGHFEAAAFRRTAERSSAEYQAKTEEPTCSQSTYIKPFLIVIAGQFFLEDRVLNLNKFTIFACSRSSSMMSLWIFCQWSKDR
jgi:hypothetical protein